MKPIHSIKPLIIPPNYTERESPVKIKKWDDSSDKKRWWLKKLRKKEEKSIQRGCFNVFEKDWILGK